MTSRETIFTHLSPFSARLVLALWSGLLVMGMVGMWNWGAPPVRPNVASSIETLSPAVVPVPKLAPDLQLYKEAVEEVRGGANYYAILRPKLLHFGFPITSTFNWRLPTYAYLLAGLQSEAGIQVTLLGLCLFGIALQFRLLALPTTAEDRPSPIQRLALPLFALLLQWGVLSWAIDGYAFYTQEVWGAALILIAICAIGLRLPWLAIPAALLAVCLRELALPVLVGACGLALWEKRWKEAGAWTAAITCFILLLYWHSQQVKAQLLPEDFATVMPAANPWLKFGGLDFVLLTTRMNRLLIDLPGGPLWAYWLLGLLGIASRKEPFYVMLLAICLMYLGAYCVVGMALNMYWGLMYAPLLAIGVAQAPTALWSLVSRAQGTNRR